MRYAVIGDIHGNLVALEAVLAAIEDEGADALLCVGDIVGYAASPVECIELVRERADHVVAGNHDYGTVGKMTLEYFNVDARDAVEWTREQLTEDQMQYLRELPLTEACDDVLLVHSTPDHPEEFSYIQTLYDAALAFEAQEQHLAFVGHSHVPITFFDSDPLDYYVVNELNLPPEEKVIVNCGSVGQPRDLDPRSAYALVDTEEGRLYLRRVDYDIEKAARKILEAGLPETNAHRLYWGR